MYLQGGEILEKKIRTAKWKSYAVKINFSDEKLHNNLQPNNTDI